MMRKFAVALSLAGVLSAGVVQALGLGEASVESTLNQPLKAEIELVNIRDLEDNEILPGLASREEFLKAGVERIYFLSDVRFEVQRNADGKVVVHLTTTKPVREPFLNFLVEVIWPSGRLLREYALLIDPPIYSEEPIAPVQQVQSSSVASKTPTAFEEEAQVAAQPVDVNASNAETSAVQSTTSDVSDGTYGPTSNSDTMWAIALKVRPNDTVTAQQTMLAIQDLNPDSFIQNNINTLKKGQILRLPTINQIRQRSKRDAVRDMIVQNRNFENKALSKNVVDATPDETMPVASQQVSGGDELKLVVASDAAGVEKGAHAGDAGTEGSTDALKNDLAVTLEKLDQTSLEKKELNSRVEDLEVQLETLQRLLTLKDDQLANLQTQMGKEEIVTDEVIEGAISAESTESSIAEGSEAMVESTETVVEGAEGGSPIVEPEAMGEEPKTLDPVVKVEMPGSGTPEAAAPVTAPVKVTPVEESLPEKITVQSIVDMVINNPLYQAIVGGIVILLLLIVWALSRRNAQKEQEFFETRNEAGEEPGDIFDTDVLMEDDETIVDTDASELEEDDAPSIQSETEDVIAEADIYIAYGRLDQASQLLENAISSEPQRTDIRLKLLEVYAESNEIESFDKQFSEVEALNDDYALEQATQIKVRLDGVDDGISIDDLESQLLSGEDVGETNEFRTIEYEHAGVAADGSEVEEVSDIDNELSALEQDNADESQSLLAEEDDLDIDFDINDIDLEADGEVSVDDSESLDFDLEDTDFAEALATNEDELEELEGLDIDLSLDLEVDSEGLDAVSDVEAIDSETEIVDLDELSTELELDEDFALDNLDLSVEDGLSEIEEELEGTDLTLDVLDNELVVDEDELVVDDIDALGTELDEDVIDAELSLDDLDLELDKIDSDLDINFDLGADEVDEEVEEVEEVEIDDSLLDSGLVVDELEEIADVLVNEEDDLPVVDEPDDTLLEESELAVVAEEDGFDSELADDEDFDFLAGTDEAATKLDLARAYIDMGDGDGAKDILEEVALEGNNEQKQEAQDLLKTLD